MQTTLRVDDEIYRQAKAEAAREGITLTKFIEEALELRLRQVPAPATPGELPVFRGGPPLPPDFDLVKAIKEAEGEVDRLLADKLLAVGKRTGRKSR